MALNNIFNEPRREITEQVLGTVALFGGGYLFWVVDSFVSHWILTHDGLHHDNTDHYYVAMFFVPIIAFVVWFIFEGIMHLIHWVGEKVCAAMANRGFDPRPTQRY
jgi:hypothetical protein